MEKYNIKDLLFEDLIQMELEAEDFEDAIRKIGEDAYQKGYVKKGFAEAVIKREKLYPTALPTEVMKVAIPHPIERDTVEKSAIIVTKLKNPVDFILMGSDNETVPVNITFTLAVNGAEHKLTILQKLVGMFSEKESMEKIKASSTPKEIITALIELLS